MLVIRQVEMRDLENLLALAEKAGKGMTSLPSCKESFTKKVQLSADSFARPASSKDDFFFTVLEDTRSGHVIGTASIYARTGSRQAFYAYRVMPMTHYSHSLDKQVRSELLHLTNDYTDCSEVASLFVDPDYRGNGRWLATSRYLLMGQFQDRFAKHVIAELRGIVNEDGHSPFWDAIGQHFFEMEYEEADSLCGTGSNQFITELMPKHPIYTNLLPEAARKVIGKPNKDSKRAMEFLQNEGYEYENVIDIFDGGPIVRAKIEDLRSVRNIGQGLARSTQEPILSKPTLLSTSQLQRFRAINTPITARDGEVHMSAHALETLEVSEGELVRFIQP